MSQIKEHIKYMSTPEGRLEQLKELSLHYGLFMYVPHDERMFSGLTYGYNGYFWDLGGSPKRNDYVQLLRREDTLHMEFCEPVENPLLKGRLGLIKIIDPKIIDDEIKLRITAKYNSKFYRFPYKEVDNLELTVVNEPHEMK